MIRSSLRRAELAAALVVVAGSQAEVWSGRLAGERGTLAGLAAAWSLPLLAGSRWPGSAGVAAIAAAGAAALVEPATGVTAVSLVAAVLSAFWLVGAEPRRWLRAGGLVAGYPLFLFTVAGGVDPDGTGDAAAMIANVAWTLAFAAGPWLAGRAVAGHGRRAATLTRLASDLEREREERARLAVEQERDRIARELHAIIASSVTRMTAEAAAARLLVRAEPARAREAILAVEQTGRDALAETRRLLGVLRRDGALAELEPQPGLRELDRLAERCAEGGLPVRLRMVGEHRPLSPGADLAAYRVIEAALAGAGGDGAATSADLVLAWGADAVELEVTDDGTDPLGRRLELLRVPADRLALYGGRVDARRRPGGTRVTARLPFALEP